MNKLKLIIRREFIAKVRNKSFIMMTFLSPIFLVGMGALVYFLMQKNDEKIKEIVYVDNSGIFSKECLPQIGVAFTGRIIILE